MSYFLPKGDYVMMYVILCMSIHMMLIVLFCFVPTKAVPLTPFELWTGRKPSLNHLKVWGCPAEVKLYNPTLSKLDSC